MKQFITIFLFALVINASLVSCGDKAKSEAAAPVAIDTTIQSIVGLASIEPITRIVDLNCESSGVIQSIYKNIGDSVKQGELILAINNSSENAQIQQSRSKITTQEYSIIQLQSVLQESESALNYAKKNFQIDKELFEKLALTKVDFDKSENDYIRSQKQYDSAKASLEAAKSKLQEINSDITYYQTMLSKKELRAPAKGVLLSMDVRIGQNLSGTTTVGQFAPEGPLVAITEVDELFADKVFVGMKAQIRPQGSTEVIGTGTVILTAPYLRKKSLFSDSASNLEDRRVREVRIELDPNHHVLIGSRVECVIQLK